MTLRRGLLVVLGLAAAFVGAKMFRAYRGAQLEFHRSPWTVGPPPADLRGAEAVTFPSRDGSALRGWWVAPSAGSTVVLVHGSDADRRQLVPEARLLASDGHGVLLFDWPGLGESGGRVTWSRTEPPALQGALDFIDARNPGQRIGGLGFSMGAGILASVAARDQRLRALVLEALVVDMNEELANEYGNLGPFTTAAARWGKRSSGWEPGLLQTLAAAPRLAGRPLLIIAGDRDPLTPPAEARRFFAAAGEPKALWIVPGAGHGGYAAHAPEYPARISAFFRAALRPPGEPAAATAPPGAR